ncbi:MAG: hypothetical protein AABX53_02490 [Nanoarchaeota archaeon]
MSNELLLKELHDSYASLQRSSGVRASLDELDVAFYVRDAILSAGYVSSLPSQQLCARIADVFMNWNSYLHGLVMPDPHFLVQMNESKFIDSEGKKAILALIARSMVFVSRNTLFHARADLREEARFIDESLAFWKNDYQPTLISILETLRARWSG